jgi:5-methylcytosine-specific restriction endonuclease McrA
MPRSSSWSSSASLGPVLRCSILARDDCWCGYCGTALPVRGAHLDHVQPRREGGPSTPANLVTACERCNLDRQHGRITRVPARVRRQLGRPLDARAGRALAMMHYPSRVRGAV